MASTFAWLDFDESARQRMREIVGLLQEEGTVDELGLGRIRDVFSERLFPGTSVLWRRARYLLFVPWTYQVLERDGFKQANPEAAARAVQRRLRTVLSNQPDHDGLIGLRTPDPVTPPDSILWPALRAWGIRSAGTGTLTQYRSTLRRRPLRSHHEVESDDGTPTWRAGLPPLPPEFPESASFGLEHEEARFLRDRAVEEDAIDEDRSAVRRRDSLLAWMLKADSFDATEFPWELPLDARAGDELRAAVHYAGCFSDVMHGARLSYALQLAKARESDDDVDAVEDEAADWIERITRPNRAPELVAWLADLAHFWSFVRALNPAISEGEERFVRRWSELTLDDPEGVLQLPAATTLVVEREMHVKRGKSRLSPDGRDRGDGGAIPRPMTFRWANALQIATDIRRHLVS